MDRNKLNSAYYRRSSFIIRLCRYGVTVLLLLFLLSCILLFRNDITIENMQLLAKFITISDGSSDNYSKEFSVNSNQSSKAIMLRDNLAIIDSSNISLYNLSGQKLFNYSDYTYSSPAVAHNEHYIMVYDVGGEGLSIFKSFSKILSTKFSSGIICADIANDAYAVVTNEDSYKSALKVYKYSLSEHGYKERFEYLSNNSYITAISLSDDGKYVVEAHTSSEAGSYKSGISIYDTDKKSDKPVYSCNIDGELPIKVGFSKSEDNLYAITDSSVYFYDKTLKPVSEYKFNQSKIRSYFEDSNRIIFAEANNLTGNSMTLKCYSKNGSALFSLVCDDQIYEIAFGKNKIYALGNSNAYEISNSNGEYLVTSTKALSEKYNSIVVDTNDNCYIINNIKTTKLSFK